MKHYANASIIPDYSPDFVTWVYFVIDKIWFNLNFIWCCKVESKNIFVISKYFGVHKFNLADKGFAHRK